MSANLETSTKTESKEEERVLKAGYFSIVQERVPINDNPANCFNEASAYLLYLEQTYMQIPEQLQFPNLQDAMPGPHKERLSDLWDKLLERQKSLEQTTAALKAKWRNPPKDITHETAQEFIEDLKMFVPEEFKAGLQAIISNPDKAEEEDSISWRQRIEWRIKYNLNLIKQHRKSPRTLLQEVKKQNPEIPTLAEIGIKALQKLGATKTIDEKREELSIWQKDEKGLRTSLFFEFKNYIMGLRAYYIMLNEKSEDQTESVLPMSHPERQKLAVRIRYLEIIDATHQSLSAAKAAIHQLKEKRIRKTENWIPAWVHSINVTLEAIKNVVPHVIEEDEMAVDLITLITAAAVHDLIEDTAYDTDYLIGEFLRRVMDIKDSSLAQIIKTGFPGDYKEKAAKLRASQRQAEGDDDEGEGEESEMILRLFQEKLDFIGKSRKKWIKQIIRIVSNNTKLTTKEAKNATESPLVARKKIRKLFDISTADRKGWNLNQPKKCSIKTKTFNKFPEEWDEGKLTKFLIRLNAIAESKKVRQIALLIKLEDRTDNISTIQGIRMEKRFSTLRATVTRLLAWCMLDHNQTESPLFNSISHLIDVTLREYKNLSIENPELMEKIDYRCIQQLEKWQRDVIRLKVPERVKQVFKEFHTAKNAT